MCYVCKGVRISYGVILCKLKAAYELRISDWSSDVCSSDLDRHGVAFNVGRATKDADDGEQPGRRIGRQLRAGGHLAHRRKLRRAGEIGRASCRERVCQYV